MKKEIEKLIDVFNKTEQDIFDYISELEDFSSECRCDNCETWDMIHHGEWKEIQTFCLNCGGYVENLQ